MPPPLPQLLVHVDAKEIPWQPLPAKGNSIKILHRNPISGATVALLRTETGFEIPPHRHGQMANFFIVSGTLRAGDGRHFATGSYLQLAPFQKQGPFRAEGEMIALGWFPADPSVIFEDGSALFLTPEGPRAGRLRL